MKLIENLLKEMLVNTPTGPKIFLEELCENIDATNEPKKSEGGNPDYQITKKGTKLRVAFIEAKYIDKDLNHKEFYDQFNRYKKALTKTHALMKEIDKIKI